MSENDPLLGISESTWIKDGRYYSCPRGDNISSRVREFRRGSKVQKHVGRAGVAMNAKHERTKRFYPLFMQNESFLKYI